MKILYRMVVVAVLWWRGLSVHPARRWRWALGVWVEWGLATAFVAALCWTAKRLLGLL